MKEKIDSLYSFVYVFMIYRSPKNLTICGQNWEILATVARVQFHLNYLSLNFLFVPDEETPYWIGAPLPFEDVTCKPWNTCLINSGPIFLQDLLTYVANFEPNRLRGIWLK